MIGDDVEISIINQKNGIVRIGITSPKDIPVFRKELYKGKKQVVSPTKADMLGCIAGNIQRIAVLLERLNETVADMVGCVADVSSHRRSRDSGSFYDDLE